ncbi:MAG: NADP-dependent malic enzyme [Alphaproteobacteria bacterium]|nr:NADP-dependent malic enzyme [Alphaproteobacteria bacterium]
MPSKKPSPRVTDEEALAFHSQGRPGKLQISPTKPLVTQRDLSLAYSPGVAVPCLKIQENPDAAYDYTARGNLVAVISNGTAVLGLGDLGALASKPVMEGKAVLFKRFADVDGIDLEISTRDVDEFINCVRFLGPSFGGINLEDIKAPDCFIIEQRLREIMDIPVFHDDQHGTAIIAAAGLINALELTGRTAKKLKMVVNGAGASAIACVELFKALGVPHDSVIMCDTKGVIYAGRTEGMNQWKSAHAVETKNRTLEEAMKGADIFVGLSQKGAVTPDMVKSMAKNPIIFAMANPDPEITPEEVRKVRDDAIIATGRSDYPNQVNNVLGFPYIFRGALDVRASTINDEMKLAAAKALADLAREDVPDEVVAAYGGRRLRYGPEYLIPVPFDPRLVVNIPAAVAEAAMRTKVARKPIADMDAYRRALRARLDPTADSLELIFEAVRSHPRRVVFAEGEEDRVIRAALQFKAAGYGTPVLVAREEVVREHLKAMNLPEDPGIEIHNARLSKHNTKYTDHLYRRLHRKGYMLRDCQRMVNQNRNVFAATMVAAGDADAMVTGLTRSFIVNYDDIRRVFETVPPSGAFGLSIAIASDRTVFLADTAVHIEPSPERLAEIAIRSAEWAHRMGHEPRVALLSFASFGQPQRTHAEHVREAVRILDARGVKFEYDGEMTADVALDYALMKELYPFCRLTGPANVLVMPNLQAANISSKLLQSVGGVTLLGPILNGLEKPAQIVRMGATVSDLVTTAVLAAYQTVPVGVR